MECRRVSLFNSVSSYAQGTEILLVHSDTLSLGHLSSLLCQYSFRVTATNKASAAIDMVCQQEGRFKLVMAKANMPDMSTISFLNTLLLKQITVIFVYSGQNDGGAKEAFDRGLCYLLQEPIQSEDLIYVWQQVYNSNNNNLTQEIHFAKSKQKVHELSENQEKSYHEVKINKKGKRALNSNQVKVDNNNPAAEMVGEETREHDHNRFPDKRPRISWTSDLHQKFLQAISDLGKKDIRPKFIQEIMNVPYLTCRHVASHLQKFKSDVRRRQNKRNTNFLPEGKSLINTRDGTKSSSSIQSQCHQGNHAISAFQNENQNENHVPVSFSETEDLAAVVRGAVPVTLMDENQNDIFGSGFTEYDSAQNCELQTKPHKSDSSKPFAILGELEPCASVNQSLALHSDNNILRILGGDSEGYDCFNNISRFLEEDSDDTVRSLKAKQCSVVGETIPDALKDDSNIDVLKFLGDDSDSYGCFGNALSLDDISILEYLKA